MAIDVDDDRRRRRHDTSEHNSSADPSGSGNRKPLCARLRISGNCDRCVGTVPEEQCHRRLPYFQQYQRLRQYGCHHSHVTSLHSVLHSGKRFCQPYLRGGSGCVD
jgi:hypothetical protein